MLQVGDVVADKYRIERVLGKGGMGYVVAAVHTQLDQRVAVKFLMPELCVQREPIARFLREARAAVRIRSEHVARVLDVGTLPDGGPFMVMEYLDGHDLASELDRRMQLPVEQAVDYVLQASEAIAEAHSLGIVHRDLKPANLFLTRRADDSALIKVLDFGISKAIAQDDVPSSGSLTATQSLLGSPNYMSPEQVRKPKTVDMRTDIWSLGVILYELLTGALPFTADTAMSVLAAVVSDPTPRLRDTRPDAPEGLEHVVTRCLSKEPAQRYGDISEFAQALAPFAPASALPSIRRIAGVLRERSSLTPPPEVIIAPEPRTSLADDPTLIPDSRDSNISTDETMRAHFAPTPSEPATASRTGETAAQWEHSRPIVERAPRRVSVPILLAAGLLAVVGGAALLFRPHMPLTNELSSAQAAAADLDAQVQMQSGATRDAALTSAPSAASELGAPPAPTAHSVDGGSVAEEQPHGPARPAVRTSPARRPPPRVAPASTAQRPPTAQSAPPAPPPDTPAAPSRVDPLEGRR